MNINNSLGSWHNTLTAVLELHVEASDGQEHREDSFPVQV